MLTPNELREKYLNFFEDKGHKVIPSSPLVPENDPSTLFTSAGMQSMVPYLLGQDHPLGKRIVNSQKCFRAEDLEEVGDNRHTTFFEMLGNWSLGDYFKEAQLNWFFEFLLEIGLDPNRLYVTVYQGHEQFNIPRDNEAIEIWQKIFEKHGIKAEVGERIFLMGKDNWWSRTGSIDNMPEGEPGGPSSEVFFDFYPERGEVKELDDERFLEIGNSVFMCYQKTKDGFKELPAKNIDFGGGFMRILTALNNDYDAFKTDLYWPIVEKTQEISNKKYDSDKFSFRVIADHVSAAVMLMSDGVLPGSQMQSYVVRRLIRRAIRYGRGLGIEGKFLVELGEVVREIYKLESSIWNLVSSELNKEEDKFNQSLEHGLKKFSKITDELTGEMAFDLFQSYGFPLELSIEEAVKNKIKLAKNLEKVFSEKKQAHAEVSRSAAEGMFKGGLEDNSEVVTKYHTATHLLHSALREVLGDSVSQKGSNITGERLRFDFSYERKLDSEQVSKLERLINSWIEKDLPVTKQTMSKEQALKEGALAFFVEKYPDQVDVYSIEGVSKEICGGPHVKSTGEIGKIEIFKEKAVSAGVRRIYARLGAGS